MNHLQNIIISRTDSIGDVVLTLPMAAVLKQNYPGIYIAFLGKKYTQPIIQTCKYVDAFIDLDNFMTNPTTHNGKPFDAIVHVLPTPKIARRAKKIGIPLRIGTTNRLYHFFTCNKLVRLGRKRSDLHESQLNIKLLSGMVAKTDYRLEEIALLFGMDKLQQLSSGFASIIDKTKYNLIIHPTSQGSSREWPLQHYITLIKLLDKDRYNIFISGTEKEKLKPLFDVVGRMVCDIVCKMDLSEFISFLNACDGLLACSTGPLHIAAALHKNALGLYPPIRPLHPGRWQPIGKKAHTFVLNKSCSACVNQPLSCTCISNIKPNEVLAYINNIEL